MADIAAILEDLAAESAQVDHMVDGLPVGKWAEPTPAEGWTIAHQIAHLAWTDQQVLYAVREPEEFQDWVWRAMADGGSIIDDAAARGAAQEPGELLAGWRQGRACLAEALRDVPEGRKLPWIGTRMSAASMATARLMETWAHGQDVADTLGLRREPGTRLWHVARIGVHARDYAFTVHSRTPPEEPFRVELTAPDGDTWVFGPEQAAQRVSGSALDFCLLATQRRHRADTELRAVGDQANTWLDIAQAFAGPPGSGRGVGQFA